tara:strand:- start:13345 stop:14295 length:951 start_codon:yes stop_codon:yes gene_type:complete
MKKNIKSDIGVVIVTYNSSDYIEQCLDSLISSNLYNKNIVIVDNNSQDDTLDKIEANYSSLNIIKNKKNVGYGAAINQGTKFFNKVKFFLFMNPDSKLLGTSLNILYNNLITRKYVLVSPQLLFEDLSWQRSNGRFPGVYQALLDLFFVSDILKFFHKFLWKLNIKREFINPGYCDGAVMLLNAKIFNQINKFDEDYFFYCEETDLCKRLRDKGFNILLNQNALAIHDRGGNSTKTTNDPRLFIEFLVKGNFIFLSKHSSKFFTKLYKFIQILHNSKMFVIYNFLNIIFVYLKSDRLKYKKMYFMILSKTYFNYKI